LIVNLGAIGDTQLSPKREPALARTLPERDPREVSRLGEVAGVYRPRQWRFVNSWPHVPRDNAISRPRRLIVAEGAQDNVMQTALVVLVRSIGLRSRGRRAVALEIIEGLDSSFAGRHYADRREFPVQLRIGFHR
jgi:hypothetical protein